MTVPPELLSFRRDLLSFSSTTSKIVTFFERTRMAVLIPVVVGRDYAVAPEPSLKEDVCGCASCRVDKNSHKYVYRDSAAAPLHLESKEQRIQK